LFYGASQEEPHSFDTGEGDGLSLFSLISPFRCFFRRLLAKTRWFKTKPPVPRGGSYFLDGTIQSFVWLFSFIQKSLGPAGQ